ncbi:helix-turn-helix domain-containing protein, partial [Actinoplanes sp. NPDC051633]|uniref:helix-turn-helix domain-containing protein n=1 Tax=Actinoplanes sp. NPDC051633 TaxID=3155670 RepID=UPI0034275954
MNSAENALLLVVALRDHGRLRVADAARLLSVTPPTAHRLLTTLKRQRFAEQDHARAYLPGPRLQATGTRPDPTAVARPALTDLATGTGAAAYLVTLEGNGCRFVDGVLGGAERTRVGHLLPAHTTAGGKVLLAQLPGADLLALYP